jgi:hypothetical protein
MKYLGLEEHAILVDSMSKRYGLSTPKPQPSMRALGSNHLFWSWQPKTLAIEVISSPIVVTLGSLVVKMARHLHSSFL